MHPSVMRKGVHGKANEGIKASNITGERNTSSRRDGSLSSGTVEEPKREAFIVCPASVSADNVVAARSRRCGRVWCRTALSRIKELDP